MILDGLFIIKVCFGFVLYSRDTMMCSIQINLYIKRKALVQLSAF